MHEVVAWPCMGELTGNMGIEARTTGRAAATNPRSGDWLGRSGRKISYDKFFFHWNPVNLAVAKG
jgi:hypothetical protein